LILLSYSYIFEEFRVLLSAYFLGLNIQKKPEPC